MDVLGELPSTRHLTLRATPNDLAARKQQSYGAGTLSQCQNLSVIFVPALTGAWRRLPLARRS